MTCKDCIHFDVCQDLRYGDITNCESDGCGGFFKPKSSFVELPCEVGQIVYLFYPVRKGIYEAVVDEICLSQDSNFIVTKDLYFNRRQSVFFEQLGKTIFLSREEAENALRERSK